LFELGLGLNEIEIYVGLEGENLVKLRVISEMKGKEGQGKLGFNKGIREGLN